MTNNMTIYSITRLHIVCDKVSLFGWAGAHSSSVGGGARRAEKEETCDYLGVLQAGDKRLFEDWFRIMRMERNLRSEVGDRMRRIEVAQLDGSVAHSGYYPYPRYLGLGSVRCAWQIRTTIVENPCAMRWQRRSEVIAAAARQAGQSFG